MELVKAVDGDNKEQDQILQVPQLPLETIYEILSRSSLDSLLLQCRWVCKEWRSLCDEHNFKSLHSHRTGTISGYFVQARNPGRNNNTFFVSAPDHYSPHIESLSLDFLPKPVIIQASSRHGLLCCSTHREYEKSPLSFYICKPATHDWIKIPNPKTRYSTERMEIVVKQSHPMLHYKIIRFSTRRGHGCCRWLFCEIFDSIDWAWNFCDAARLYIGYSNVSTTPGVFVNGAFYWSAQEGPLHFFHMDRKRWSSLDLPQENDNLNNDFSVDKKLVVYEGKLGVIYTTYDWIELWVLEDYYTKEIWRKVYKIYGFQEMYRKCTLQEMYSTDIMSTAGWSSMKWYNCQTRSCTGVVILRYPYEPCCRDFIPFQSDSVPCKLR